MTLPLPLWYDIFRTNRKEENSVRTQLDTQIRRPQEKDAAQIWELVKQTGTLDLNSAYSYLMLCKYFADTCAVVEQEKRIVGFVSGFIPPTQRDTLFIWQVATDKQARGKGFATSLIQEILTRDVCTNVCFVDATVSPSNVASNALFRRIAQKLQTKIQVLEGFNANQFPSVHEDEPILRIGPFKQKR